MGQLFAIDHFKTLFKAAGVKIAIIVCLWGVGDGDEGIIRVRVSF
jgi:hypothetical protein